MALNGDIDNYQALRASLESGRESDRPGGDDGHEDHPPPDRTVSDSRGHDLAEAFRLAVNDFEGSHAIAMSSNLEPGKVFLALKGSGQAIYVGLTPRSVSLFLGTLRPGGRDPLLRQDGRGKPADPSQPDTTGQIFILDQESHRRH